MGIFRVIYQVECFGAIEVESEDRQASISHVQELDAVEILKGTIVQRIDIHGAIEVKENAKRAARQERES